MVPNFCRGCGKKLEVMERAYCARPECQEKAREVAAPAGRTKDVFIEILKIEEASLPYEDGRRDAIAQLRREVQEHPWDDCSPFLSRHARIREKTPEVRRQVYDAYKNAQKKEDSDSRAGEVAFGNIPRGSAFVAMPVHAILMPRGVARLVAMPSGFFRCTRLEIAPEFAHEIVVRSIDVGTARQMSESIPGNAFLRGGLFFRPPLDTANQSAPIILTIENAGPRQVALQAILFGTTFW